MKISLTDEHKAHLKLIGHTCPPRKLVVAADEFAEAVDAWKASGVPAEELEKRAVAHIAWEREKKRLRRDRKNQKSASGEPSFFRRHWHTAALILIILSLVPFVHCQYDGPVLPLDSSGNVQVNCILGCSATAGFTDNSAFTVGSTTINPLGAYYTNGAAPTITTGNAGRIRMDASSILMVDCSVGCSGSSFADNSAFTAGTTPLSISAGWYTTSPTNCTSGDACAPQLTIDRKLFVQSFQGTSPWVDNITQWNSVALGSPSAYGTSPGAVNVPGVNAFVTNAVTVNAGTNLNTSALALDTSVNGLLLSQGSATSGQKGPLMQGAVTTGAPTYTTAQTSPLSLTTGGALRVDGSGSTQPVSGTITITQGTGTNLHMVCDSGCSSSTAPADNSTFTESSTSFSPIGGYFRTSPTSLTTDHMGAVGMTASRHLFVNLPDALPAGTNVIGHVIADSGSTTVVTGNVATTIADGANVVLGSKADAKSTATDTTAVTIMQVLKEISALEQAPASTPVTGTFFQATQPVSCLNGTTCPTNATLQAGSAIVGKVGIDQTTPGTTNAVQDTNFPAPVDTNSGNKSASTIRMVIATDQPNLTTALNVNCTAGCVSGGSFSDNSAFTAGSTAMSNTGGVYNDSLAPVTSGNGATARITANRALHETPMSPNGLPLGTQTNPVYVASLPPLVPSTSKSILIGALGQPIGTPSSPVSVQLPPVSDPCSGGNKRNVPISVTANTQLVTTPPSATAKICSIMLISTSAETFSIVGGTGATCGTGTEAIVGSTTAANGPSAAANGGYSQGVGMGTIAGSNVPGNNVCILISGSTLIAGNLVWAY